MSTNKRKSLGMLMLLFLAGQWCLNGQTPKVSSGNIVRIENFPSRFVAPRNVDIWLPSGYSSQKKYAVLYMNDGQMLFDSAITWNKQEWGVDETVTRLIQSKKIKECIVVGIWNSGSKRHSEYFPQKPYDALPALFKDTMIERAKTNRGGFFADPVNSDAYLRFLVQELKLFVDSSYSTLRDRASTFIGGSSMGGLISMYAICEYPNVFGGAACISTHWPGIFDLENNPVPPAFMDYLRKYLPDPNTHKIYYDYGTATLDELYEPFQLQVDAIMKEKGYSSQNWMTRKFEGAEHSETAWKARFSVPLEFLMAK